MDRDRSVSGKLTRHSIENLPARVACLDRSRFLMAVVALSIHRLSGLFQRPALWPSHARPLSFAGLGTPRACRHIWPLSAVKFFLQAAIWKRFFGLPTCRHRRVGWGVWMARSRGAARVTCYETAVRDLGAFMERWPDTVRPDHPAVSIRGIPRCSPGRAGQHQKMS